MSASLQMRMPREVNILLGNRAYETDNLKTDCGLMKASRPFNLFDIEKLRQ